MAVVEGICRVRLERFTQVGTPYFEAQVTVYPRQKEAIDDTLVQELADVATQLLEMLQMTASSTRSTNAKLPPSSLSSLPMVALKRLKSALIDLDAYTADELSDVLLATLLPSSSGPAAHQTSFPAKVHHLSLTSATERVKHASHQLGLLKVELDSRQNVGERYNAIQARKAREAVLRNIMEAVWQELRALKRAEADDNGANDLSPTSSGRPGAGIKIVGRPRPGGKGQGGAPPTEEDEEDDEEEDDVATLGKKVAAVQGMSTEARAACKRELKRLKIIPPQSPEHGVLRNYLDWMCALPWGKSSYDDPETKRIDRDFLTRARQQLDDDHFGLESVKERLLQYLAILRLRSQAHDEAAAKEGQLAIQDSSEKALVKSGTGEEKRPASSPKARKGLKDKGPILLLVGPPGVGKTSIARSLAAALGRPYHRISLGGVRDEAEIRGHRRTYVASMPGVIIQALRKVEVNNPLILLDEIDKLSSGSGVHGDPSAAMLEVLDPEQNFSFNDHYINVPVDLSSVLFVATANSLDTIPAPLLDRMEVLRLGGYVDTEKLQIARRYLLPKALEANVLRPAHVDISDETIKEVVGRYCAMESGVRTLERQLGTVCRYKAVELARARDSVQASASSDSGKTLSIHDDHVEGYNPIVKTEDLEHILGNHYYEPEVAEEAKDARPGIATGLAYSSSGNGGIMFIEATSMPGKGNLVLTGSLGDVISESAKLAFSWVKANAFDLGLSSSRQQDIASGLDVHLHCPAGSISKNGPSAGGVMVLCMVSMFSGHALDPHLAMTGEMTLRGKVTPIGGVKEKCLGAHRAGITKLILPERNRKDYVADVPDVVKEAIQVNFVDNIWQALEVAFGDKVGTQPGQYVAAAPVGAGGRARHLVNGISRL